MFSSERRFVNRRSHVALKSLSAQQRAALRTRPRPDRLRKLGRRPAHPRPGSIAPEHQQLTPLIIELPNRALQPLGRVDGRVPRQRIVNAPDPQPILVRRQNADLVSCGPLIAFDELPAEPQFSLTSIPLWNFKVRTAAPW